MRLRAVLQHDASAAVLWLFVGTPGRPFARADDLGIL
jgi:hypothetical protein